MRIHVFAGNAPARATYEAAGFVRDGPGRAIDDLVVEELVWTAGAAADVPGPPAAR